MYPRDLDRIRHQMFNSFMEPFPVRQISAASLDGPGGAVDIRKQMEK